MYTFMKKLVRVCYDILCLHFANKIIRTVLLTFGKLKLKYKCFQCQTAIVISLSLFWGILIFSFLYHKTPTVYLALACIASPKGRAREENTPFLLPSRPAMQGNLVQSFFELSNWCGVTAYYQAKFKLLIFCPTI